MFKKRLKGLLAMLLAGSIAAMALPLTASAGIIGDITVYNGDTSKELNYANLYSDTLVSGNLNSNSLWGVYYNYSHHNSGEIIESGTIVESVSGDKLLGKIGDFDGRDLIDYSDVKISAQHKYIVTTEDPSTTSISIESVKTTSTFPLEISLSEYGFTASPLIDHYSCTAWYGVPDLNSTIVSHSSLVESNVKSVTSSADSKEITVGMEAFAGLYSADIDTVAEDKAEYIFENGITILQLKSEYKTLSLPVKNALLRQETDSSGDDRHISVSKDSESLLDEGDYYFYLCYYDEEQQSFKISDSAKKYEKDVWDVINAWVNEDPNLDTNKLFLCRKVTVNVNNGNGVDTDFNTKDLLDYLIVNKGNYTTNQALLALFTAKPNSIWEVNPRFTENPPFYIYQKDAATSISDFLLEYPHEKRLNLFEQSSIRVTALDPKTSGEIEWGSFIESKLLDKNGEPRKISDYFNDLFAAVPQKAGKKYDTDGWQLWAGVTSCGGLYDFSKVELDKKPDSIGVTELNKMQNSIAFVYFPQVEIAPSLEVTAPVAGETPSTQYKILDKLGGYSVDGVEWDCDYTLLVANDKFEAGKKYRVKIDLLPDGNLSFVDSTPVTINGKEAFETILDDAYFSVYQVFTTAPEKPVNVKATAGDGKVDLTWESGKGAYGYNVYFYNKDGTLTEIARTQNNSYTVEKLEDGTKYGFVVRSVSAYGDESSYTAEDVVYATTVSTKPQNVKATPGNGQVTLTWDAVPGATAYAVSIFEGGAYNVLTSLETGTSYTVTGLTNGKTYEFLVQAFVGGWTTFTTADHVSCTPVGTVITKPSPKATPGNGQITLTWDAVPGATAYAVSIYEGGVYNVLTISETGTSYTVTGLTNGKTYEFLVQAFVGGGWTTFTTTDHVSCTPVGSVITKPSPKATPGNGQVTLTWDAVPGATAYAISIYEGGAYNVLTSSETGTSYTVTGLTNGKTYEFLVQAFVGGGWTTFTTTDHVSCTPVGPVITKPSPKATPGNGQVTLTWDAVPGATAYAISIYEGGAYNVLTSSETGTSYTVTGLTNGKTYEFLVQAFVGGGWTTFTTTDHVSCTPVGSVITKPSPKATPGNGQVTLTWDAVPGATAYAISIYEGGAYNVLTSSETGTSYTVTGLTNGKTYEFLVQAFVGGGWTTFTTTDHVSCTPVGSVITKPSPKATPGNGQVTLTWDAVPGATAYAISIYEGGAYNVLTSSETGTSYTVTGLTNGKTYEFLVQAFVGGGWTTFTTTDHVSCTPVGSVITKPSPEATPGNGQVTLTWDAVPGATAYAVSIYEGGAYNVLTSSETGTSYTVTGLTNGKTYEFLVQAFVGGNWTVFTTADHVSCTPVGPVITKPSPEATPGNGQVTLTWDAVPGATAYAVSIYEGGAYNVLTSSETGTSYTVTGLTNGKTYEFLVQAFVGGNWTVFTTADHVSCTPVGPVITKPSPKATPGNGLVTLTWDAVPGATAYAISIYEGGAYNVLTSSETGTSYTVTGLTNGKTYEFLVQAFVGGNWTVFTTADHVSCTPVGPVITKPSPEATPGNGQVTLTWDAVPGATAYAVSIYEGGAYNVLTDSETGTSYTVTGLTNGKTYEFLVQAFVGGSWTTFTTADHVSCTPNA